jgi:hypothetical protein
MEMCQWACVCGWGKFTVIGRLLVNYAGVTPCQCLEVEHINSSLISMGTIGVIL